MARSRSMDGLARDPRSRVEPPLQREGRGRLGEVAVAEVLADPPGMVPSRLTHAVGRQALGVEEATYRRTPAGTSVRFGRNVPRKRTVPSCKVKPSRFSSPRVRRATRFRSSMSSWKYLSFR